MEAKPTGQKETQEKIIVGSASKAEKKSVSSGGSAAVSELAMGSSAPKGIRTKLNPLAKEWDLAKERAPEEKRCLYLTCSNGHPLNEPEITHFFNQNFGGCVEKVYVHRAQGNNPAGMFAKVVFHFSSLPMRVLGKENEAKFVVNAQTLWCKRYDPRKDQNQQ